MYEEQTAPLIEYYKNKKVLKDVVASQGNIDDIVKAIVKALDN